MWLDEIKKAGGMHAHGLHSLTEELYEYNAPVCFFFL